MNLLFALVFKMRRLNFFFLGLLSWNVLHCHVDLEEELKNLTNQAPEGEAARHGNNSSIFSMCEFRLIFLFRILFIS